MKPSGCGGLGSLEEVAGQEGTWSVLLFLLLSLPANSYKKTSFGLRRRLQERLVACQGQAHGQLDPVSGPPVLRGQSPFSFGDLGK